MCIRDSLIAGLIFQVCRRVIESNVPVLSYAYEADVNRSLQKLLAECGNILLHIPFSVDKIPRFSGNLT